MTRSLAKFLVCGSLAAFGAVGCSSDDDTAAGNVPGVNTGTLVQNWTIEGSRDPVRCTQYGADRMRVVVFDEDGSVHATEFAACTTFELRMELLTRRFTGAATFVNGQGNPVSKTIQINAFSIQDKLSLTQNLDFSADQMRL